MSPPTPERPASEPVSNESLLRLAREAVEAQANYYNTSASKPGAQDRAKAMNVAWREYESACTPSIVMGLLNELQRLRAVSAAERAVIDAAREWCFVQQRTGLPREAIHLVTAVDRLDAASPEPPTP